jgi:GH24 family phage-related lysozyme (muramidase)
MNDSLVTSAHGRAVLSVREGNKLKAYRDTVGVWTIGVGHTSAAGDPRVSQGMTITGAQSDQILAKDLGAVEKATKSLVKVALNQNQFDALVSFVFNVGAGAFAASTLLRKLNAGDYAGAAEQFLVWVKQPELKGRRQQERAQFLGEAHA